MATIDKERARAFIAAVPKGRWTSFKQAAIAGNAPLGAQAVGQWLAREGHTVPNVHRVLTVAGQVASGFRPAGPGVPGDEREVRDLLEREGVRIDRHGRADRSQFFSVEDLHT